MGDEWEMITAGWHEILRESTRKCHFVNEWESLDFPELPDPASSLGQHRAERLDTAD